MSGEERPEEHAEGTVAILVCPKCKREWWMGKPACKHKKLDPEVIPVAFIPIKKVEDSISLPTSVPRAPVVGDEYESLMRWAQSGEVGNDAAAIVQAICALATATVAAAEQFRRLADVWEEQHRA